ncbi:unnamed protein product [Cercospora beticola]|nr:unnamed protein product [Cercospora beticola]
MGDNIVAAINESMEKAIEAKVALAMEESVEKMVEAKVVAAMKAASNKGEKLEPELEVEYMRKQIIANAPFLYQLLGGRYAVLHSFHVVTSGTGAKVSGCVCYMNGNYMHVLLRGPESQGELGALQELLAMTRELMHEKWSDFYRPADDWSLVGGRGNSYYYTANR